MKPLSTDGFSFFACAGDAAAELAKPKSKTQSQATAIRFELLRALFDIFA
jgi:hypothetical protein